jgi:hypothetical protein
MNLHPTEGRPLLEDEQVIVPWPRSWPNSPVGMVISGIYRGIWIANLLYLIREEGGKSFQIFSPGWFRLVLHGGFLLIWVDWIYLGFCEGKPWLGFVKYRTYRVRQGLS